jgi:acetylornithine aminotransferase
VTNKLAAINRDQARLLIHTPNNYYTPWTGALCKMLVEKTREAGAVSKSSKVYLCTSGSEANEAALKFARKVGRVHKQDGSKSEIVAFDHSYYGRNMGSLSATWNSRYRESFEPLIPDVKFGIFNSTSTVDTLVTEKTCGVIVEPIHGEGGVTEASAEFLSAVRFRCNDVGAILIYDKIQCGLARTGQLWAHQFLPKACHPDILTTAKSLGNGYPMGATIVNEVALKPSMGDHGMTFGGNSLGSRIALNVLARLSAPEFQQNVREMGVLLGGHLKNLVNQFPDRFIGVQGRGLILGLELRGIASLLVNAARDKGLLILPCGSAPNAVRVVPPLTITEAEIEKGTRLLRSALQELEVGARGCSEVFRD